MKKLLCTFCMLALLVGMIGAWTVSAAGSMSASADKSSVTVGDSVTVTIKYDGGGAPIGGLRSRITYNADALDYTSCDGIEASGGSGTLQLVWYATGATAPTSVTYTVKFKAKAAGAGNISVTTTEFVDDNTYASLGTPSQQVSVTATNPTLSGNANLKSLKPSAGTLTPAFNANTTAYSIKVPYTTTSLSLSAVAAQSGAKVSVDGSNSLKVGNNTQVITVTAPNGKTKKYTVTITRLTQQSNNNQTTTTTKPIPPDALKAEVDGVIFTVADSQPDAELPSGYAWDSIELNGITVSAAKNEKSGLTLLYLLGESAESNAFYIYDDGEFTPFETLATAGALYVLLPIPQDINLPRGTAVSEVTIGERTVAAYRFEEDSLADISLVYAVGPTGYTGLHIYDATDGSIQRYREITPPEPVETQPEEPARHPILQCILDHRSLLLMIAAGIGAIGLLTIAIVLIVRVCKRPNNCQH